MCVQFLHCVCVSRCPVGALVLSNWMCCHPVEDVRLCSAIDFLLSWPSFLSHYLGAFISGKEWDRVICDKRRLRSRVLHTCGFQVSLTPEINSLSAPSICL